MAVTPVRKFSIVHTGQRCKVSFLLQDATAGVKYCVASPANEKLWGDAASFSWVSPAPE